MIIRAFTTRWRVAAATGLAYAAFAQPAAAQSIECPTPQAGNGPGITKESSAQIAETGRFLASGDNVNRAPEVVAELRKRYPGVSDTELENYLVTAY